MDEIGGQGDLFRQINPKQFLCQNSLKIDQIYQHFEAGQGIIEGKGISSSQGIIKGQGIIQGQGIIKAIIRVLKVFGKDKGQG